jgi:hypothetical protein
VDGRDNINQQETTMPMHTLGNAGPVGPYSAQTRPEQDCGNGVTLHLVAVRQTAESELALAGHLAHNGAYIQPIGPRDGLTWMTMEERATWAQTQVAEYYAAGGDE